jgi:hypothetical protein
MTRSQWNHIYELTFGPNAQYNHRIWKNSRELLMSVDYAILSNKQAADIALAAAGDFFCPEYNTLAPTPPCQNDLSVPGQKGNNPMYIEEVSYNTRASKASACVSNPPMTINVQTNSDVKADGFAEQRKYLERRVYDLRYEKMDEISKQFHQYEPKGPKTIKELKERLKKGLFTVTTPKDYAESDDDEDDDG